MRTLWYFAAIGLLASGSIYPAAAQTSELGATPSAPVNITGHVTVAKSSQNKAVASHSFAAEKSKLPSARIASRTARANSRAAVRQTAAFEAKFSHSARLRSLSAPDAAAKNSVMGRSSRGAHSHIAARRVQTAKLTREPVSHLPRKSTAQ
jgi:hypothetical protein